MTRDEEEELILEALEARADRAHGGGEYSERLAKEILAERAEKKAFLEKEKKKSKTLSKVLVVLLVILFLPLFGAMLASKSGSGSNTIISQKEQEINRWYAQADSEISRMTDEEIIKYAQFLYEELETESGYGAHYYKYMRIIKQRNISCTGQPADGSTECHYN